MTRIWYNYKGKGKEGETLAWARMSRCCTSECLIRIVCHEKLLYALLSSKRQRVGGSIIGDKGYPMINDLRLGHHVLLQASAFIKVELGKNIKEKKKGVSGWVPIVIIFLGY